MLFCRILDSTPGSRRTHPQREIAREAPEPPGHSPLERFFAPPPAVALSLLDLQSNYLKFPALHDLGRGRSTFRATKPLCRAQFALCLARRAIDDDGRLLDH